VGRKKLLGAALVVALAAAAASVLMPGGEQAKPGTEAQVSARPGAEAGARAEPIDLPERSSLRKPGGELFAAPPPPPAPARPVVEARPEPKPQAPPMPYRVAGQVSHEGTTVVLARDERVYLVRVGETLDGGYRVESIRPDGVTLVYTPLDLREHLAAASTLRVDPPAALAQAAKPAPVAAAKAIAPAQLRWQGPARVQAGNPFEVALKLTSDQAVRGSPLQLSYDARLLEPVAVRAGEFFADGSFTYRVSPDGSILVGAFGKGEVPADAEFLVVTFKPVRAGVTAELKLSSVALQDAAGGPVVHAPLAAFRTSITP
jgi:hypothetical protein